jgi:hypothetical protein
LLGYERIIQQICPPLRRITESRFADKNDLLVSTFRLHKENGIKIYYAPFDFVNESAKIVLIGITPGWKQMEIGHRSAKPGLQQGMSSREVRAYAET